MAAPWQSVRRIALFLGPSLGLIGVSMTNSRELASFLETYLTGDFMTKNAQYNKDDLEKDGCGLDGGDPNWIPYSASDNETLQLIRQCKSQFPQAKGENFLQRSHLQLTKLACRQNISLEAMRSVTSQYNRIWFIGDSVMRQQYLSFLCMLNPYVDWKTVNCTENTDQHMCYIFESNNTSIANATTIIQYSEYGWKFNVHEPQLYELDFPEAIRTSTQDDAIFINAGLHYDSTRAEKLVSAATFIATQSMATNASVHFVETTDTQWPTTNGLQSESCYWFCQCEALTEARIQGMGIAFDKGPTHVNISVDWNKRPPLPPQSDRLFTNLYPDLYNYVTNGSPLSLLREYVDKNHQNSSTCIPSCLPANWRNDIVRPILLGTVNETRVHLVPIWRQLVARGIPNNVFTGDCVHKTADALVDMNRQLIRSLLKARQDFV